MKKDRIPRTDQTKVMNQPALQTSNGLSWMIMGGLLFAVSLFPFGLLIVESTGNPRVTAITTIATMAALYLVLLLSRPFIVRKILRLRVMAACMISMTVVALVGAWLTIMFDGSTLL